MWWEDLKLSLEAVAQLILDDVGILGANTRLHVFEALRSVAKRAREEARNEALEEAAKVCEPFTVEFGPCCCGEKKHWFEVNGAAIGSTIRELKDQDGAD
jgi:hypothetical protein